VGATGAVMRVSVWRLLPQLVVEGLRIVAWTAVFGIRYAAGGRRRPAALVKRFLLRLGPLYIKVGQILGTQSGLLPPATTEEFRSLFAEVPAMPPARLRRILRRDAAGLFATFDEQPIAAGSVAQVHPATLYTGESVVVKVVKAGVPQRLTAASLVLTGLIRVAHTLVPAVRRYDLRAHFAVLRPLLTGQCDMVAEAGRQEEVAANFRNHPFLRVPRTYPDACRPGLLVMDRVDAVPGEAPERAGFDRKALAARLLDVFNTMTYFHGLFHVDPHPGNIMFGPAGELVMLDFGLVGRLSETDKWNLSSFYYACIRWQWTIAAQRFTRTFADDPAAVGDDPEYWAAIEEILRHHFEAVSSHWSTMSFLDDASRLLRRHGTVVSTRFSVLALCIFTGEGFLNRIDPDMDIWAMGRTFTDRFSPFLGEHLRETFERELGGRTRRTAAARRAAAAHLVAPTHFDRFVLPSSFPLVVERAAGARIVDLDGNEYVDLSGGYGPHLLGYGHPVPAQAIRDAVAAGGVNALGNPAEIRLAELLSGAFGPDAGTVLANSGTEAVQVALRMARAWTGRQRVAKFEGHYHGFSDQGMVSSWFRYSGDPARPEPIGNSAGVQRSVVEETLILQYGLAESLEMIAAHASTLACVIVEPMQSVTGRYDDGFLRRLAEVCARTGVLLVFDEVVSGFRVTYGGVQHLSGVRPDLTCLGKIIGGGLPCGAVVGRSEVIGVARSTGDPFLDVETRAFAGGTMSGNSITAAAGAAVLTHLSEHPEIYDDLDRKTVWLMDELRSHADEHGLTCEIAGQRSIFTITFDYARPRLVRDRLAGSHTKANIALACYMRKRGVYLPELHTLMLSDAHTDADLKQVADAFAESLDEMSEAGFFTV
jgi:glutamate-1-semialdehyde 2,1-aminomutase